jgi:molybdate transport system permease protein
MSLELWQTLWLSLRISALATIVALAIALPLAHVNARSRYWGKSLLEGLIVVPMVLPPTVVGYLIIAGLGVRGWIGQYAYRWFAYSILFRLEGAVPLLYLPTRAAFAAIDRDMEDMARVMGANRLQLFWHVSLPMARRGLASGLMLAFARALGEFGATVMVFGIRINHTTLPVSIYVDYEQGDMHRAAPAVGLLCMLSMAVTLLYNRSALSRQE